MPIASIIDCPTGKQERRIVLYRTPPAGGGLSPSQPARTTSFLPLGSPNHTHFIVSWPLSNHRAVGYLTSSCSAWDLCICTTEEMLCCKQSFEVYTTLDMVLTVLCSCTKGFQKCPNSSMRKFSAPLVPLSPLLYYYSSITLCTRTTFLQCESDRSSIRRRFITSPPAKHCRNGPLWPTPIVSMKNLVVTLVVDFWPQD